MSEVRERSGWFSKLQRLKATIDSCDTQSVTTASVKAYLEDAERIWDKIDAAHSKILAITTSDDAYDLQMQALEPMEDLYTEIRTVLFSIPSVTVSKPRPAQIKLPDFQLPNFEGRYEDWTTFSDLFKATVDSSASLSGSQKLQYLKSCVKGEAAGLIKSFPITDANYSEAWELLVTNYENKREIVHAHVTKLLFQPTLKTESAAGLQQMLNTTNESLRSLKVLGRPTTEWDDLVAVLLIEKFDPDTKSEWAKRLRGTDPVILEEVTDFITQHIRTLHAKGSHKQTYGKQPQQQQNRNMTRISTHHTSLSSCQHCRGNHQLFQCAAFKELSPEKRLAAVKAAKVCFNCLRDGHNATDCKSGNCRKCNKKHNTLLHISNKANKNSTSEEAADSSVVPSGSKLRINRSSLLAKAVVLLKTAVVDILDRTGCKISVRILLDDGGEGCLIREEVMMRLGLPRKRAMVTVTGVGDSETMKSKWQCFTTLFSQVNSSSVDVELYAVPKITGTVNALTTGDVRTWTHISGLQLADPHFFEAREIDILLGSDVVPYLLKGGLKILDQNSPVAQETMFGWVISGKAGKPKESSPTVKINSFQCEISNALRQFWEIEELPNFHTLTIEEEKCEKHFLATHVRQPNGRYMVRLPFNEDKEKLGGSRDQAFRRLRSLERRFERQPQYKEAYISFMREYEALGHMEKVTFNHKKVNNSFYLPHHFVLKEDSTTTKQRTVFDGSAKSTSGLSLNDVLMVGATVQPDLFTILLRFRYNPVALKADVAKMYRNFDVHSDDRDYQKILWREDTKSEVIEYRLTTVTYGTGCAPFCATRCLNQLAKDEKKKFPAAAEAIRKSTYVDDYLGSSSSEESAIELVNQLIGIMATAGMETRKWCTNSATVLSAIPEHLREECTTKEFGDFSTPNSVKALGIKWEPATDQFCFTVNINSTANITKRLLLSEISKTFDPLGWLSPVTINAKLLMQRVWIGGSDWDNPLSSPLQEDWDLYVQNIIGLENIRIPRCVISSLPISVELHGYSDSSELAFASAVYLKCKYGNGTVSVHLLTSRTRVAPIKCVSLPKLELCGAKLLADTIETIQRSIDFPHKVYCWTDSTITLRWITSHSRKWKTFVANRVSSIQTKVPPQHWYHVKGEENPADLPSRGITTQQLASSSLWWNGPSWLQQDNYPTSRPDCDEAEVKKEERAKTILCNHFSPHSAHTIMFASFSSFVKLVKCAAILYRYRQFLQKKCSVPRGIITAMEFRFARNSLVQWVQRASFPKDFNSLENNERVPESSRLSTLFPFIDSDGLLRVGGRLQNAGLSTGTRHPLILPHDHQFTKLVISHYHIHSLHGGATLTQAAIRSHFWILRGPSTIQHVIRKCVTCRRAKAATMTQLMGSLPAGRVTATTRPFIHCGVDYAGPFSTKLRYGRGRHPIMEKTWFAIFVCLSTKAVHLETVTSLSTEAFIACLERFAARRGVPAQLYSDCGTNFVGADRILQEFLRQHNNRLWQQAADKGITWNFNPPAAPHQGGLWEAGVKSVKFHFRRVVGQHVLHLEEFQTLLCRIEACLNSRPLCAISSGPTNLDVLTPGHFIIGEPLTSIPEPDVMMIKENKLKHWELIRQLSQHFWRRWQNEYLLSLQQRFKWKSKRANLEVGDLVVVAEDNQAVSKWRLGRVIETHPGEDGLVRKATVKTMNGEVKRPITKLSPILHINESQ